MPIEFIIVCVFLILFTIFLIVLAKKLTTPFKGDSIEKTEFSMVEEENSPIQWKKADESLSNAVVSAINYHLPLPIRVLLFIVMPLLVVMGILAFFTAAIINVGLHPILGLLILLAVLGIALKIFINPFYISSIFKKKFDIWVCYSPCIETMKIGPPDKTRYYAVFKIDAENVLIKITYREFHNQPVGKEYIFYKMNENTGNPWKAVQVDKLTDPYSPTIPL